MIVTTNTHISPTRRRIALALSIITLLCAILFYLSIAFVTLQAIGGVYDGPILALVALFFSLPTAIVCTVIALVLVGHRECKIALISLCSYPLFFILALIMAICAPHR